MKLPWTRLKTQAETIVSTNWAAGLIARYFSDEAGVKAAALAYYLLFSIFPIAILISSIIGMLNFDVAALAVNLRRILPVDIVSLLVGYLSHVQNSYDSTLMSFSIVFSIYFPWRAVRGLMNNIREAFRQSEASKPKWFIGRELLCTLMIPLAILLSLLLILLGRNVIELFLHLLPPDTLVISDFVLGLWDKLRFVLAGLIMLLALGIVYQLSLNKPLKKRQVIPGTLFALVFWLVVSYGFSFYTEHFARYSLIYGTLGGLIVLLLWLWMTGLAFILGGELNAVLLQIEQHKQDDNHKTTEKQEPLQGQLS